MLDAGKSMSDGKKLVLAVDDDEDICDYYQQSLTQMGYRVVTASSGREAKNLLAKELPDVILMDIMIPDIDGISLTREIHSAVATAGIPILAVSALTDAATLNDALLFGAMDYIAKPVDAETLKIKISGAIALAEKRRNRATT
ncbi:MAG: response regulator [Elusimicrobia bacterium]|nr:response regulator [Elusimicrobiota bacterium]